MQQLLWQYEESDEYEDSVDLALSKVKGPPKKVAMNLKVKIENLQKVTIEELVKKGEGRFDDIDRNSCSFFAIEYRDRVRIYIVSVAPNLLFFSHALFKKNQKLDSADTERVKKNYNKYLEDKRGENDE